MDTPIFCLLDVKASDYSCLMFTAGQHRSLKCEMWVPIFEKQEYQTGSEASELLWLLLVTFSSGIWQQAHGRAQLFDEYFESEGPKDSAGHMLPSVFALWNDNVASLRQDSEAAELPFLAARNIIGQTWRNRLHVCTWRCMFVCLMSVISLCLLVDCQLDITVRS